MIVPSYWAEARTVLTVKGRRMTLRRFGWSDESLADAQAQAELRAAEAAERAASGQVVKRRELKLTYNGAEGIPIREEVLSRQGEAVITRNVYGARCLNVADVLIGDIDFKTEPDWGLKLASGALSMLVAVLILVAGLGWPGLVAAIVTLVFGKSLFVSLLQRVASHVEPAPVRARRLLDDFLSQHPDWRVRVYRTPAGLRLIATHARFSPTAEATQAFFQAVGVDPVYARMCVNQHCFRARLSAKPWRAGIHDHLKPRPGVWPIRPERMPDRAAWVARYESAAAAYAACHHEATLGAGIDDAGIMALVALHDAESAALDVARPLA